MIVYLFVLAVKSRKSACHAWKNYGRPLYETRQIAQHCFTQNDNEAILSSTLVTYFINNSVSTRSLSCPTAQKWWGVSLLYSIKLQQIPLCSKPLIIEQKVIPEHIRAIPICMHTCSSRVQDCPRGRTTWAYMGNAAWERWSDALQNGEQHQQGFILTS